MDFVDALLQRPVIIALAIAGGGLATVGSVLLRKGGQDLPNNTARFVLRLGYVCAWVSVGLFVAAGFRG
ncbi:MAG: hypothetical protein ACR2RB_00675 [Gammaproteobacteria bacterium]